MMYRPIWNQPLKFWLSNELDCVKHLKSLDKMAKTVQCWTLLAEKWNGLNDEVEVRRCLNKAIELCSSFDDWNLCRRTWLNLLDDKVQAKICRDNSRGVARTCLHWITYANTLSSDTRSIYAALKKGEAVAGEFYDYTSLAISWQKYFGDIDKVSGFLKKAELVIYDASKWKYVASLWEELIESSCDAERCLKNVIRRKPAHSDSWKPYQPLDKGKGPADCVESLCQLACDRLEECKQELAYDALQEAEQIAEHCDGWLYIATHWKIFNQPDSVARCLENAECLADSNKSYLIIAELWFKLLGDQDRMNSCVDTAKEYSKPSSFFYCHLAKMSLSYPIEGKDVKGYLKISEELIRPKTMGYSRLWLGLAELWSQLPNEMNCVRHCLLQAEENIELHSGNNLFDNCAKSWDSLVNNQEEVRRCLRKSQPQLSSWYLLSEYIRLCIELTGTQSIAKQFLYTCHKTNSSFQEWIICSQGWLSIDTNTEEAKFCLEQAEKLANTTEEWKTLAKKSRTKYYLNKE